MVTTKEAAPAVRLNADWQAKYRQRAQQLLLQIEEAQACQRPDVLPSVCVVGRCGVGKSSLVNHLFQQNMASICHSDAGSSYVVEETFDFHGLFCIREIPGYDGWHAPEPSRRERFRRHLHRRSHDSSSSGKSSFMSSYTTSSGSSHSNGSSSSSSHSSSHGSSSSHRSSHCSTHGKGRRLKLDEFVEMYSIFESDVDAVIFVVNTRITPDDEKLLHLAVEKRKFFCIVCTHMDFLAKVTDKDVQKRQLEEQEEVLRKDLSLLQDLEVRIFFVSIPFTAIFDSKCVMENIKELHFPLLQAYLLQPRGLLDEIQIRGFVKEEVINALGPYTVIKKRQQAVDFTEHVVAGALIPILGPIVVTFLKTLWFTLKACSEVGLIEDANAAIEKVNADAKKHALSANIATKEGLITGVHDALIHIFGRVVFDVAISDLVSTAAEASFSEALPLVGAIFSAASLPGRAKKIGERLAEKACMLHELWIMQNVSGLLEKTDK